MPSTGRAKGQLYEFTLSELVLVIMITAILVSILLPGLGKTRPRRIEQIACINATKQAGLAQIMYASDYGGSMTGRMQWVWKLEPYTATADAFACPSWGTTGRATTQAVNSGYCVVAYGQYTQVEGYHVGFSVACSTTGAITGRKMDSLRFPGTTMWLAESDGTCGQHSDPNAPCANGPVVARRHNNGCDTVFVDGHSVWERAGTDKIWTIQPWKDWLDLNK